MVSGTELNSRFVALAQRVKQAMSDMGSNKPEAVSAAFTRWMVSILIAALLGLAGIVWANITGQISELRADGRIAQKDTYDLKLSIQDLKNRVTTLVETLNERSASENQRRR